MFCTYFGFGSSWTDFCVRHMRFWLNSSTKQTTKKKKQHPPIWLVCVSGWLEWTTRLGALQLPAGVTRRCSSRTCLCSACSRTQKRITGAYFFFIFPPACRLTLSPTCLFYFLVLFFTFLELLLMTISHYSVSSSETQLLFFPPAPSFPRMTFAEAETNGALWDLIVSVVWKGEQAAQRLIISLPPFIPSSCCCASTVGPLCTLHSLLSPNVVSVLCALCLPCVFQKVLCLRRSRCTTSVVVKFCSHRNQTPIINWRPSVL